MTGGSHLPMGEGREFDAIRAMLEVWGPRACGIGDDAAVVEVPARRRLVVSTDATVEDVHFWEGWITAEEIGGRAAAAALSDLAAMGAAPLGLLLALGLPERWSGAVRELADGVGRVAEAVGCPIVGGNVSRASELSLTITVLGSTARPLGRRGACAGDLLYVTGALGGPGAALAAFLRGEAPSMADRARFAAPWPRIAEGQWIAQAGATAAIDLSDGLVADAGHLARASGVALHVELGMLPRVAGVTPEDAARSGEEYELLFTVPPHAAIDTEEFARRFGIALTRIGEARSGAGVVVVGAGRVDQPRGHDHFS